jgi:hypothetical protein
MRNEKTSGFLNEANQCTARKAVGNTSNSLSETTPYRTALPLGVDIFSGLAGSQLSLYDNVVSGQVRRILTYLYLLLQELSKSQVITNYLSRLNLVCQEDGSALLEWNFQDFRVGFTLEPNEDESSFFVVSQDKNKDLFSADTQKLDVNNYVLINKIVGYVLENT